ncbi:MAG: hypothetical protein AB8H86_08155 [Polyangiales bacterium]
MRISSAFFGVCLLLGACGDDDSVGSCPGFEECLGQVCKCSMDATVDVLSTDVPDAGVSEAGP